MGVVNTTPDSFSDGGLFQEPDQAIAHGLALWADGADLVDVGGESTRPGSEPVPTEEELARVIPVVAELAGRGVVVSVDTTKSEVAGAALEAGAEAVNDVTALSDPSMAAVVADSGAGIVLMHMKGTPRTMQKDPQYGDVVGEVRDYLVARAGLAVDAGVEPERICIDPGIGFGKTIQHNLELLVRIDDLVETGYPVLLGTSRKRFLGEISGISDPAGRDIATSATLAIAISKGVSAFRVHNVALSLQIARIADAIVASDERP